MTEQEQAEADHIKLKRQKLQKPNSFLSSKGFDAKRQHDDDLFIYSSSYAQEPNEAEYNQRFINPGRHILINKEIRAVSKFGKNEGKSASKLRISLEVFDEEFVYVTFNSKQGCVMSLSAQFPSEVDKQLNSTSNALICREFIKNVHKQVKE